MAKIKNLQQSTFSEPGIIIFALIFCLIGGYVIFRSFAAGPVSGDINGDGYVTVQDLSIVLSHFGQSATAAQGDTNGDGTVTITDLSAVLSHFGQNVSSSPTVPAATGSINVDGNLSESDWNISTPISTVVSGTPNNSATFGTLWDNTYLYIGVKVLDSSLKSGQANCWDDDSVEVYIDPNDSGGTSFDNFDKQLTQAWNSSALCGDQGATTPGVLHAWATITGGYSIEMAIPWNSLGVTPTTGMNLGFDINVNDDDNGSGRDSGLAWHSITPFNPSTMGQVTLTGTPVGGGGGGGGGGSTNCSNTLVLGLSALGDNLSNSSNLSKYCYYSVSADDASAAAALPGKAFVYMSGADVSQGIWYGMDYQTAVNNNWLLKDSGGSLCLNSDYHTYLGDIGNAGYQQSWISQVLAFMNARPGLKGIWIDNVLASVLGGDGSCNPAKYSTWQSWSAAQLSFMQAVHTAFNAQGYMVAGNVGAYIPGDGDSDDGTSTVAWEQSLAPYIDIISVQNWIQTADGNYTPRSSGSNWDQNWDGWMQVMSTAIGANKIYIPAEQGHSSDTAHMQYTKGSFYLLWDGGSSAVMWGNRNDEPFYDPWQPALEQDIGTPTAPEQNPATNAWTRTYSGGYVMVNSDPSNSHTFTLPAGTWHKYDGSSVSGSVTVQPTTGLILSK